MRIDERAFGASYIASIARMCVTRGILLDRVPAWIDEALTTFDDPEAVIEIDFAPNHEATLASRMNMAWLHVSSVVTLSEYYEKVAQMEKARSVLTPVRGFLAQLSVSDSVRDVNYGHNLLVFHAQASSEYWKRLAEIDERESRKEEALKDYREALLALDSGRDESLARQRRLWKDLGRSDEAWQAWVDSIPRPAWKGRNQTPVGFSAVHRPLPAFTLKDLDGKAWSPAQLQKKTVAVAWATWCEPCRNELPYFAKLAERLKGRTDVQAISINTDENPETAKQFVEKNGYQFPVLLGKNVAEDLMPYFSIPRTWIIEDGVIVDELEGFGGEAGAEQWLERVAARLR